MMIAQWRRAFAPCSVGSWTGGATAALLVKPEAPDIVVVTASSRSVYGPGRRITFPPPFSKTIAVDEVFRGR